MIRTSRSILKKATLYFSVCNSFKTGVQSLVPASSDIKWENALPYEKIPGPSGFKGLRNFLPGGLFYNLSVKDLHLKLKEMYGEVVKFPGILRRKDMIFIYDPNDFELLHRTEGIHPYRIGFDTLAYYKEKINPELFKQAAGLASSNGDDWYKIRTKVNPVMLQPKTIKQYIPDMDTIALEFIDKIRNERDQNNVIPKTFGFDVNLWALESIALVALDTRLNALTKLDKNSEAYKLVWNIRQYIIQSFKLEFMPSLWRYYKTPLFKKQMQTIDDMTNITMRFIEDAIEKMKNTKQDSTNEKEESVLQKLLKIDRATAIVMALDMLQAGSDTTGSIALGLIYQLGVNPDKQNKLREEAIQILPNKNTKLTNNSLDHIPYLRACLKETHRLQPVLPGNVRGAGQDLVIKGYRIPKGTTVGTANLLLYYDEKSFPEPTKFMPERWLSRDNKNSEFPSGKNAHPFIFLPFGFGARTCIGQRLAELEMACLVLRLVQNFNIEWIGETEMKYKTDLLSFPTGDMHFRFTNIN